MHPRLGRGTHPALGCSVTPSLGANPGPGFNWYQLQPGAVLFKASEVAASCRACACHWPPGGCRDGEGTWPGAAAASRRAARRDRQRGGGCQEGRTRRPVTPLWSPWGHRVLPLSLRGGGISPGHVTLLQWLWGHVPPQSCPYGAMVSCLAMPPHCHPPGATARCQHSPDIGEVPHQDAHLHLQCRRVLQHQQLPQPWHHRIQPGRGRILLAQGTSAALPPPEEHPKVPGRGWGLTKRLKSSRSWRASSPRRAATRARILAEVQTKRTCSSGRTYSISTRRCTSLTSTCGTRVSRSRW